MHFFFFNWLVSAQTKPNPVLKQPVKKVKFRQNKFNQQTSKLTKNFKKC